jgi:hypothetical protein
MADPKTCFSYLAWSTIFRVCKPGFVFRKSNILTHFLTLKSTVQQLGGLWTLSALRGSEAEKRTGFGGSGNGRTAELRKYEAYGWRWSG